MPSSILSLAAFAAAAFVVAALVTRSVLEYCLRNEVLDAPNARSSHTVPTPRGGGISIATVWIAAPLLASAAGYLELRTTLALSGGGLLIAWIGWRDDHAHVPARKRLAVHAAAAAWVVAWLGGFPEIDFGAWTVALGPAGAVIAVLLVMWMTNLYNFMDGIDGLAGSETLIAATAAAVVLWLAGAVGLAAVALALASAAGGFLLFNWPPAKIFMGDVGSGTVGFAFGALALAAERTSDVPALVILLPVGVFIVDATLTLVRRLLRGERVYEAHRSHVYQRLTQRGWSHTAVTLIVSAINLGLALAAVQLWQNQRALPAGIAFAVGGLVVVGWLALRLSSAPKHANAC